MSLENTTLYEDSDLPALMDWGPFMVLFQTVNGVLFCLLMYMTISVIVHGTREKLWSLSTRKGKLYIAGTTAVCCAIPRVTLDQIYFHLPQIPGALEKCELLVDLTNACGGLGLFSTYTFLWVRQWMTYSHSSMKKLTPEWIHKLSRVTLGLIIAGAIIFNAIYIIPTSFEARGDFCVGVPIARRVSEFQTLELLKKYILAVVLLLLQTLLVTLFVYPMARTTKKVNAMSGKNGGAILKTIRRSLISAIGAVSSDIISLIVLAFIPVGTPILVTNVVHNTTVIINLCCVIFTFKDPLSIFLACCKNAKPEAGAA